MAYIPETSSVVAFQSDPTKLVGTVSVVGVLPVTLSGNPSVSGTVGASVIGHAPVVIVGGSILTSSTPNQSVSGTVGASIIGHSPVVIVGGSILTSSVPNQSVSGTVTASVTGKVQIVDPTGAEMDLFKQGDNFAVGSDHGLMILGLTDASPQKYQPLRVASTMSDGASNENVRLAAMANLNLFNGTTWDRARTGSTTGALLVSQADRVATSIVGTSIPPSSVQVLNFPTNQNISGSVVAFVSGLQGASVSGTIIANQGTGFGSVASHIKSGSVIAVFGGNTSVLANQMGGWKISVMGAISPTATVSSMKAIASTTTLLASNAERKGAMISNISGTSILVKLGNMSDVNNNSFKMNDNDYYETPFNYSGVIQHFASSTAGFIQVTEIT